MTREQKVSLVGWVILSLLMAASAMVLGMATMKALQ